MKIEIYVDSAGEWRWRLRSPNGRTVAASGEGFSSKPGVRRSIANFVKYLAAESVPVEMVLRDSPPRIRLSRKGSPARKAA